MLRYIRAEREADWALHLDIVEEMLPLFFAAGHAIMLVTHLRAMQYLLYDVQAQFLHGQHTWHLKANSMEFGATWLLSLHS